MGCTILSVDGGQVSEADAINDCDEIITYLNTGSCACIDEYDALLTCLNGIGQDQCGACSSQFTTANSCLDTCVSGSGSSSGGGSSSSSGSGGGGGTVLGTFCTSDSACSSLAGGYCDLADTTGFCTCPCTTDSDCGSGGWCFTTGSKCLKTCPSMSNSDCPSGASMCASINSGPYVCM
jgi:hypothetical protein